MTTPTPSQPAVRTARLANVPKAFWVGLALFALAFVLKVEIYSTTSGSLGSSCSYTNLAALFFAAGMVACVPAGWASNTSRHVARRLPAPLMTLFSVALVGLSVVHVLRGLGTVGGPCH